MVSGVAPVVCNACGNESARRIRMTSSGFYCCDGCGDLGRAPTLHDVYFKGPYMDPNLAHYKRPWEKDGVWVRSREHKAALLAEQNLREAGDKFHGARIQDSRLERSAREQGHRPD